MVAIKLLDHAARRALLEDLRAVAHGTQGGRGTRGGRRACVRLRLWGALRLRRGRLMQNCVVFPAESIAGRQFPDMTIHPVMLYELVLNLIWFLMLMKLRLRDHKAGFVFCMYFILYSVGRAAVSGFRADSLWFGPVRAAYIASAVLIVAFGFIVYRYRLWEGEGATGKSSA